VNVAPDVFLGDLMADLSVHADPERAAGERAYLKLDRELLGVTVPVARRTVGRVVARHPIEHHDELLSVVDACWEHPCFDARRAAVEVLVLRRELLEASDLDVLKEMVRDAETWALVDPLATAVVGWIMEQDPDGAGPVLDQWSCDQSSFWIRRSSMLALLEPLRRGDGDWTRFCRYAESMLDEKEFFIRKAIGWVLRDTSKRRPELVRDWVEPRLARMSGVTRREATKYLA
jgi:3-methyladenine DNA glycosylase AlkD